LVRTGAENRKAAERHGQLVKPESGVVRKRKSYSGGGAGWGDGRAKLRPFPSVKNDGVRLSKVIPAGGFKRMWKMLEPSGVSPSYLITPTGILAARAGRLKTENSRTQQKWRRHGLIYFSRVFWFFGHAKTELRGEVAVCPAFELHRNRKRSKRDSVWGIVHKPPVENPR
jgi:hypothetical protein